jgi:hypothetical protein
VGLGIEPYTTRSKDVSSRPLSFFFFETWSFSNEVSPPLHFNPYSSLFFLEDPSFAGERFHSLEFSRRIIW